MSGGGGMVREKKVEVQRVNRDVTRFAADESTQQFQGRFAPRGERQSFDQCGLGLAPKRSILQKAIP